ncbi:hypothetical protein LCM10_18280 [Rossellomorea aquimaris]|uniref:hypothetical protein n=1 Tax=Rossellomorea aquimaris TaxID=189382 RepID=UPI001CD7E305|nr:hypothetical protein [Rossellomorea aquimaris]MCA1056917.1 hypothetical protein [Rossellomorea aquimaris]
MKKQRYILCLLVTGALLYYAAPRLSIEAGGLEGIFAVGWLVLATFVIAGNLAALLYSPVKASGRHKGKSSDSRKKGLRSLG